LQLAPTPPPNIAENNVEEIQHGKVQVVGRYDRLRGSKFSKTQAENSSNEDSSVVTSVPPFTRCNSRKCSSNTDESKINKVPSNNPRGRNFDKTYQVWNPKYLFSSPPPPIFPVHRRAFQTSGKVFVIK
jgi:hypothetical protein